MNILITHFYSAQNGGDAAIASVLIKLLKKNIKNVHIKLLGVSTAKSSTFEGVPLLSSFFYESLYRYTNPFVRYFFAIYVLLSTALWALMYGSIKVELNWLLTKSLRNIVHEYKTADIIIPQGGGYLLTRHVLGFWFVLIIQLWSLVFGKLLGKPIYLYNQSIGPFAEPWHATMCGWVLSRMDGIFVREAKSFALAKRMGIASDKLFLTTDAALMYQASKKQAMKQYLSSHNISFKKPLVGITVKKCLSVNLQTHYEAEMAKFIQTIIKQGFQVICIPQCTSVTHHDDDRVVARRILAQIPFPRGCVVLERSLAHNELKSLHELCDYVVATRMHSAIFALSSLKPTLVISYEHKHSGIMKRLRLGQWVLQAHKLSTKDLMKQFAKLKKHKKTYINELTASIDEVKSQITVSFSDLLKLAQM